MKNNLIIAALVALLIGGAGGFFAGMQYQKSQRSGFTQFNSGRGGQGDSQGQDGNHAGGGFQGRNGGGRAVSGEILSVDDKSITVKLQDGSSRIVLLTNATSFSKSAEGSKSDLKTGERVAVFGTENSDGSVTAQNVQLNPQTRFFERPSPTPAK